MNKRGFELSITFIVTLILAMIILSFGIYFVKMIYERSTELKGVLDQQTNMELERLMDSGEKVSLYPGTREVNSGDTAKFGLGILNIENGNKEFKVIIKPSIGTRNDNTVICEGNNCKKLEIKTTYENNNIKLNIGNNKKEKILIGILPSNAEKGTYVFDVNVTINGNQYGDLKKVSVKVY